MYASGVFAATLSVLSTASATTLLARRTLDPNVNVTFFSTSDCSIGFPSTTHHTTIFSGPAVDNFPCDSYSSLIINAIDDRFIGQNAALQIGNTGSATVDFTNSIKFNIATKDTVGQCQFVGISGGQGKPLLSGNEFQIAPLQ